MFNYKYDELIPPTVEALKILGGSGTIEEINEEIIKLLSLTASEVDDIHRGSTTKLEYRSAWARTYLKNAGYLLNGTRGVWSLSELGKNTSVVDKEEIKRVAKLNMLQIENVNNVDIDIQEKIEVEDTDIDELNWQNDVLEVVKGITPSQFEKLCQRLLRELGFSNVEVTGKSNDGGIDGKGILKIGGVLSFHVAFQAKRYDGSVGSPVIRDFRGAMMGKADKGLIITTGNFSREAKKEAQRDGATPIDLIDGNELSERLKELKLGVDVKMIEKVIIDKEWFNSI